MATYSGILAQRIPKDRGAWQATIHRVAELDTTDRTWHACPILATFNYECVHAKSLQSCPTLCDPTYFSPPGSVYEISQARILEWVAISFSRGSSLLKGVNPSLLHLLHWQASSLPAEPLGKPQAYNSVSNCSQHAVRYIPSTHLSHNWKPVPLTFHSSPAPSSPGNHCFTVFL